MGKIEDDTYRYSVTVVIAFGIAGNILVILSILRQKKNMLKKNYYFLVLHLAICDQAGVILYLFVVIEGYWLEEPLSVHYRATVHPLKPAISRQKLKVFCGLVYLVGLIVGGGVGLPLCFIKSNVVHVAFWKFYCTFFIFFVYLDPTIFMAVVYCKISRSLIKQNKYMKRVCSNLNRRHAPNSSFNILRYIRNRQTFLVCLSIVLCYGIAHIPMSVGLMWDIIDEYRLRIKFDWVVWIANILRIAGSHSANSFIYGILDKKLFDILEILLQEETKNTCEKIRKLLSYFEKWKLSIDCLLHKWPDCPSKRTLVSSLLRTLKIWT